MDDIWNAYIRVDDVDAIYAEVQERGAGIDYTIYNAPHGFRESAFRTRTAMTSLSGSASATRDRRTGAPTSYASTSSTPPGRARA